MYRNVKKQKTNKTDRDSRNNNLSYMTNVERNVSDNSDGGDGDGDELIRVRNSHIYFYDKVNKSNALQLIDEVLSVVSMLKSKMDSIEIDKPCVYLHINSSGGCLYSAFSAFDTLTALDVKLITIAEGNICSAATIIYLAGKERWMRKHTYTLIHQIRTYTGWVTHREMLDEMETTNEIQRMVVKMYKDHTNIPKKKLDALMSHEIQMNSDECLKYNVCHRII